MLELWIVRHGQTDWNVAGRLQGWTDIPLNNTGRKQAEQLRRYLEGIPFQAIISSDLQRAWETASILNMNSQVSVTTNTNLRERCFGEGEGLSRSEMNIRYPDGSPGSESTEQVEARCARFLKSLTETYQTGRILCVTHGGIIRILLCHLGLTKVPDIHNTSVSTLQWDGVSWRIHTLNWHGHVKESMDSDTSAEAHDQETVLSR